MYKHYIRLTGQQDANGNNIIEKFMLWPEDQDIDTENDILINDNAPRQFASQLPASWDGSKVVEYGGTLDELKIQKKQEIDAKTETLIKLGFVYDSETFSMSENAQINWTNLKLLESALTWPVELTTVDDTAYSLSQANLDAFMSAALTHKQTQLDSGRALKVAVNNAVDKTALDAIQDNR
jgi:hypothetical protein